jgi:hypothetical protein
VLVFRGADEIREVLVPVYEALGLDWDPASAGSIEDAIGAPPPPPDGPDPLLVEVKAAFRSELAERYEVTEAEIDETTRKMAVELRDFHTPKPR